MSDAKECLPPEGTPNFMECYLTNEAGKFFRVTWFCDKGPSPFWRTPTYRDVKPRVMAELGYRFHSLVKETGT